MAASWYAPQQNESGYLRRFIYFTVMTVRESQDDARRKRTFAFRTRRVQRRKDGLFTVANDEEAPRVPREEHARGVSPDAQQAVREPLLSLRRVDADDEGEDGGVGPAVFLRLRGDVGSALAGELDAVGPAPRAERRGHARAGHHRAHERARARGADDPLGQPRAPRVVRRSYGQPRLGGGVRSEVYLGRRLEGGALHEAPDEEEDERGDARRAVRRARGARHRRRPRVRERSFAKHGARPREWPKRRVLRRTFLPRRHSQCHSVTL
jgi:hypothetical protein